MTVGPLCMMSGIFSIQAAEPEKDGDMEVRIKLASELLQTIQVDKILTQTFDSMPAAQMNTWQPWASSSPTRI